MDYILISIAFFVSVVLAVFPADIAAKKGYPFGAYYLFALFLFVPALVTSLLLKNRNA